MNGIVVRDNEKFEKAVKRFTKICERAGVLSDVKRHRRYEKPSAELKRKKNARERKRLREERRKLRSYR
ncbi:30S ribosomal protein S21 [Chitinivibrio alkaliphilus]|uniref:Small ribosomal subunit protein bS21 n=1 Tax=Chitinivibrio alkaliphilus ACht1 TaxID=1313304 RepID=U7DBE2_9BACT|nr:30S ribosomal protein S21 [Chitinivibrio alkaliphilus]ERP39332.1 ribosomal protein S21 [Chitinivibrio alkaliphilus ACht1]